MFNSGLLVSSADNLYKQFGHRSGPDKTSGLLWIQNVWHSDGIPERIFRKGWKKSADDNKSWKITK